LARWRTRESLTARHFFVPQLQKLEARNPQHFQMTKISKIPNKLRSGSVFWIFRDLSFAYL